MNMFKKTLFFSLTIGTLSSPLYAMHHAKRAWSGLGSGIHFALAGQMIIDGVKHSSQNIDEITDETTFSAPPHIEYFVHKVLKRENVKDHKKIKVRIKYDASSEYSTTSNRVIISLEEAKLLNHILTTDPTNWPNYTLTKKEPSYFNCKTSINWTYQDYITSSIAVLTHEAAHIKNKDAQEDAVSFFAIPIATLLLSRYKPLQSIIKKGMFTKVTSGLGLNEVNKLVYSANNRRQEKRADDAVVNRDEILASIKLLTFHSHAFPMPSSLYQRLHRAHPSPMNRRNRYVRRLEKMEIDEVVEE
jgi:hypothetical protein